MSTPMIERQSQHVAMLDRADCCGAAVAVTVVKIDARLSFCQHHYDQHSTALDTQGFRRLTD